MAEERRLVAQDRNDGLEFPAAARQLARLAANRQQNRPPIKPRSKFAATCQPVHSFIGKLQISSKKKSDVLTLCLALESPRSRITLYVLIYV